jgi:kynurenine formamidase
MDSVSETVRFLGRTYQVIDLSDRLDNSTSGFEPSPHRIDYLTPQACVKTAEEKRGIPAAVWPDGLGWASEIVTMPTHAGTHVDAPYHYGPRADGKPARTIDQLPLQWCMSDGVVLDFTDRPAGYGITAADIEAALARITYTIKPYDIVLIRTDVSRGFKQAGYHDRNPGMTRSSTEYLVDRGVRLIGIDAWGLDRPLAAMIEDFRRDPRNQFWEAHLLGREKEYSQIEKLTNLDRIPVPFGFSVIALPVKLADASAGWSRVVALVEQKS